MEALAHEIGHAILHTELKFDRQNKVSMNQIEEEAQRFSKGIMKLMEGRA